MKFQSTLSISLLLLLAMAFGCKGDQSKTNHGSILPRGQIEHLDRFEQEIQAFEKADEAEMPAVGSILFVGSSSIRMWSTLKEDFAPMPVINRGFGGSTIPEVNYYADRIVYKYKPSLIVFYAGENDIIEEHPPAIVFQDFKKFIGETEKNLVGVPVVYISAKPSPARWEHWRKYETLNEMIERFAKGRPTVHYVDISKTLLGENGQPDPALFIEDRLHMNSSGYAKWTAVLRPIAEGLYEEKVAQ
ncbi:MAG: SGNH/GDSL hydrolase family protein [Saprospiraceae bacterium]